MINCSKAEFSLEINNDQQSNMKFCHWETQKLWTLVHVKLHSSQLLQSIAKCRCSVDPLVFS